MFYTFWQKNVQKGSQDGPKMHLVSQADFEPISDPILTPSWNHFFIIFEVHFETSFHCYAFRCFDKMSGKIDAREILFGPTWDRSWSVLDPRRGARTLRILDEIEDAPLPSASRLQDHFGAILAPSWPLLTSPTNCLEGPKRPKIDPRGSFLALQERRRENAFRTSSRPTAGGQKNLIKTKDF